ncbi:serine acetyltransferase [Cohnella pontilimi]|uniref:Serine acetyltransferase n=1 Tax=Cohnella pontilimi TaxID=2564100 RepID=A0A4U0FCX4_9BACL|nr:serine acetyltransferase [Cohnella pontilimi]TJY42753.1 serine acetyltransferase [Cohnella pontilimi]
MISDKKSYNHYVQSDLKANGMNKWKWRYRFSRQVMNFQLMLRKVEYYQNCRKDLLGRIYFYWLLNRFRELSIHLGFTIPPNVFGPGLSIAHYGSIVVNSKARIGANCRIHSAVNIGEGNKETPVIGDNVYIAPGAKIFGGITIGDNVRISANAVVNKDVPSDVTVAGIPAKIISDRRIKTIQLEDMG